ncbi:aminoglycoside phosphotransferase family protein [Streptomyces sp. NBC_01515]|uniref:aminoglycoside phosphotransferase family protein n=1 Tax=Streptomyces sp. NBC_01515 TaxID=2903890 RepID=UPI00386CC9A7
MSSNAKMHADELDIDAELVGRLVVEQFPEWAELTVTRVASAGTDNAMFRLGEDMVVRLPRLPGGAGQIETEQRWLPRLAPELPLAVPVPLAMGEPGRGYGLRWGVYGWLDGENVYDSPPSQLTDTAVELGRFAAALRRVDAMGGPVSFRGGPVGAQDADVRKAIEELGADGTHDATLATAAWEHALALPQWETAPVWLHGDLLPGNLLATAGRLTSVIDFGGLGVGDPAADALPAWALFSAGTREVFREAGEFEDEVWARGRGWALCFGLVAEQHYRGGRNPVLAGVGHRAVREALEEFGA